MVISQVESRQPKQVEFRFHPFNETSPLRSQVQSWCAHDRKPLRFSFQGGLPVVEKYRADLQLLGEDDRFGFAGLKTGLLLDPGDSLRIFDVHNLDPISRGFSDFFRSRLPFSVDYDLPIDRFRNQELTEELTNEAEVCER